MLKKSERIVFFDGIAILCIILFHELIRYPQNPFFPLTPYLVAAGLSLFTFSSGYKLMINHADDISRKDFLGEYYLQRFVRLYKPYIGYTVLTLLPLVIMTYLAIHLIHLDFPTGTIFTRLLENTNIIGFLSFLGGVNPIADQLWYLVGLLAIISFSFTVLYFFNVRWFFLSFIPLFIISLMIQSGSLQSINILNFFSYAPVFIAGCFWAYKRHWSQSTYYVLAVLFLIILVISAIIPAVQSMAIYLSCFFSPMFLLSLPGSVNKVPFIYPFLVFCGTYSFQIYLFHQPLILHILSTGIIDILKINYFFMPIVVSVATIYCCVAVYKLTKLIKLNGIFE